MGHRAYWDIALPFGASLQLEQATSHAATFTYHFVPPGNIAAVYHDHEQIKSVV